MSTRTSSPPGSPPPRSRACRSLARRRLQHVVVVEHDLAQRHVVERASRARSRDSRQKNEAPALVLQDRHHRRRCTRRAGSCCSARWARGTRRPSCSGCRSASATRFVFRHSPSVLISVGDVGRGLDEVQVAVAFESLLDDLQVEEPRNPQRIRIRTLAFGFQRQRRIVQRQRVERLPQVRSRDLRRMGRTRRTPSAALLCSRELIRAPALDRSFRRLSVGARP